MPDSRRKSVSFDVGPGRRDGLCESPAHLPPLGTYHAARRVRGRAGRRGRTSGSGGIKGCKLLISGQNRPAPRGPTARAIVLRSGRQVLGFLRPAGRYMTLPKSCWAGVVLLTALCAFQRPFRIYPSLEPYDDVALPEDWRKNGEWIFGRLMYPVHPNARSGPG